MRNAAYGGGGSLWLDAFEPWLNSIKDAHIHAYNLAQRDYQIGLELESDTCLVVVTVFKIVAPTLVLRGVGSIPTLSRQLFRMKSSRSHAMPSVDSISQAPGDAGLPRPFVVDGVRRELTAPRSGRKIPNVDAALARNRWIRQDHRAPRAVSA